MNKTILLGRRPLKPVLDLAALGQAMIRGDAVGRHEVGLSRRLACIDFYFRTSGVRRLQATTTRSGTLWTQTAINAAMDLARGGDGEYVYNGLFWPTNGFPNKKLDWRVPLETTNLHRENGPVYDEHKYFHTHHPYFRVRSAQLRNMKIIVVTRSIFEVLESKYFKYASVFPESGTRLDLEESFAWDKQLSDIIEFFNSWGDVMTWHPAIRHYRYEDLKRDPVGYHKEILAFWDLDIPEECIAEGFRLASKKEMKKRFTPEEIERDSRVSFRGKNERGVLTDERKRYIVDRIRNEMVHDLGHSYDYDTEYGFEYD
ncbi:MAG: hypothetical protein HOM58_20970 [Rhodospirillaceae bacterium]|nr:hypothetical protein [Rhodospirillaceae bacterium]MBT5459366.1 hypothetical protein [Rhodospirillaceae bacterium]